ncbi:PTS sugar transporter subunit IIB [Vibrio maritimus]|uniref:PTS sugar transporter subunit IIB n=1 Tax=Vibrio maritimus TaxID=990268 RepID=UPI0037366EF2
MKNVMVMCGTGIATSTLVTTTVKEWLADNNLENLVVMHQGKIADEIGRLDEFDILISTTAVPDEHSDKCLMSLPLLQGIGVEDFYGQLEDMIRS